MAVLIHQVIGMNTITKLARLLLAKEEQVRGLLIGWISLFFAGAHAYTIKANEDKLLQRFAYYF